MKKFYLRLLLWLATLALCAAFVVFVGIPLFTEEETVQLAAPEIFYYEGDTKKPVVMENEFISFEMDPATTHFQVTDKVSGAQWLSNPAGADKDPKAVSSNKENLQATAIVTYATAGSLLDLNNFKYSIENGNYAITQQEDGSVRVDYAIGKIEKIYLIPTAITQERFNALCDQMKKATQKKIKSNYTLYEPSKLDSKKNKDEIIAMYPSVTEQALYILKSETSETNKKKIEGYFAEANYSQEDYEIDQQLVAGAKDTSKAVFNISLIYRLEGGDLVVEVPYEEIRYKAEYPITSLTLLPMFGAAGTQDEGFMLVPEGGGSIINFNNGRTLQNSYYANLYGWDYATTRKELVAETRSSFPVFGMARNGSSFLCMMEGATSYASLQADVSGRINSYNWMCAKYNVLHQDQYNVSAKTAQLVFMFEKELPKDSIIHRYRFFDTDSYVDMANHYGEYLAQRYPEQMVQGAASEVSPASVELIGAIDKTVVKFGLPIDSVFSTTTFQQAEEIISGLTKGGVKNLNVRYAGWANGGVTQQVMTKVDVLRELGGKKALTSLIAKSKALGVPLYLDGVNCFAYDSGVLEGFMPFTDAARYTTREQVELYPYDVVHYQPADWLDTFYLVRPDYARENTTTMLNALKDMNAYGVSFRDIGTFLSADYNAKNLTTREQVKAMNIQSLKEAAANGQHVMIRTGNDYAVPYADLITDMDLLGSRYAIIDENVPFYQIALHGMKDYTGEPINLAGDYMQEFLTCVEYGAGLHFTFMAEDSRVLQDTTHSGFFGSSWESWKEDALAMITRYQADMEGLNQQRIVSHDKLTRTLSVTGYEGGAKVYVNYGTEDCTVEGVVVPARSYTVERGQ